MSNLDNWRQARAEAVRDLLHYGSDGDYSPTELPYAIGEALTVALKPYRRFRMRERPDQQIDLYVLDDYTIWHHTRSSSDDGIYVLAGYSEQEKLYDHLDDDGFREVDGRNTSAVQAHGSLKIPYGGRD